jgi:hypothetical protein
MTGLTAEVFVLICYGRKLSALFVLLTSTVLTEIGFRFFAYSMVCSQRTVILQDALPDMY